MAAPFSRSLGELRGDRGRNGLIVGGLGLLLLSAWGIWLFAGQIAVYRISQRARLEVSPAPTQVAARSGGRILEVNLLVGARVAAGDRLVVLDAAAETITLARARARLAALEPELASVAREVEAEAAAGRGGTASDEASELAVRARQRALEVAVRAAEEEEARTRGMVEAGVQPAADLSRAIAETMQRRAARDAAGHEAGARGADRRQREASLDVRREQLERQRAELEASLATLRGEIEQLVLQIERHTLRAPIDGVLGEVAALRPGAELADGAIVATVVPDGTLQVIAEYAPAAIGRLVPGQRAQVRLDGFPWTDYGTLDARVARVGSELRNGVIRVELTLAASRATIPLSHGMTGDVEIEVEQASPIDLLVRSIGKGTAR